MITGFYNDGYGLGIAPVLTITPKPKGKAVVTKTDEKPKEEPKQYYINKNQDEPFTDGKYWFTSRRGISPYDIMQNSK